MWSVWTRTVRLQGEDRPSEETFKLAKACGQGPPIGSQKRPYNGSIPDGLVGSANEVDLVVDDIPVKALLDTGATVSMISESFYKSHLAHIPIEPLYDLLDIESATGDSLPYVGYIDVTIATKGSGADSMAGILLIFPSTRYSARVPVLLGTNI
jgi:hypothetical protein